MAKEFNKILNKIFQNCSIFKEFCSLAKKQIQFEAIIKNLQIYEDFITCKEVIKKLENAVKKINRKLRLVHYYELLVFQAKCEFHKIVYKQSTEAPMQNKDALMNFGLFQLKSNVESDAHRILESKDKLLLDALEKDANLINNVIEGENEVITTT